ncbi:MAG: hypothetical protein HRT57_04410 [Crocinitomicaceae bacterium]|nr:hypothetical protein [Crocinitomicaceae bacterium]
MMLPDAIIIPAELAELVNTKLDQFKGEEGCELSIKFFDHKIIIDEEQDCDASKGHRTFFGGTLKKK